MEDLTDCEKYGHVYLRDSEIDTCSVCKQDLILLTADDVLRIGREAQKSNASTEGAPKESN